MKFILKTLIISTFIIVNFSAKSQDQISFDASEKFYIRFSAGYSFETGKTEFNNADPNGLTGITQSTDITVSADGSTVNIKSLNGTVGAGIKANFTMGYMFNPYVGAELGVSYFHGDKTLIGRLKSPQVASDEYTYLRGFDVAPGIFLTPNFQTINPYARLGAIIPIAGHLTIDTRARQANGGGQNTDLMVEAKSEVKSRFSVGYFGAIGVTYPINPNLSLFGEVEIKNLSIKSKSAEIIEYKTTAISNGNSQLVPGQQLEDLPIYEKQFEFSDDFDQSTTANPDQNSPRKIPTQFVNASGTGINVGIRVTL